MSRSPNYKNDADSRALRWRHSQMMRLLERGYMDPELGEIGNICPEFALAAVVWPTRVLLEISLDAVTERATAAA